MSIEDLQSVIGSTPSGARKPETLTDSGLRYREELLQISASSRAIDATIGLARKGNLPAVTLVADYGVQGSRYAFGDDQLFRQVSLVMRWNLFDGFSTRAKTEQARIQRAELDARYEELSRLIELQIEQATRRVALARQSIGVARDRLEAARNSFRLVRRRHEEGMASQIEFIDARTALTAADVNLALTQFDYLARLVQLERAAATHTFSRRQ